MRSGPHRAVHLTYCSNIHPGESWGETLANVRGETTKVKAEVSPDAPFGVGLRLSAAAAEELKSRSDGVAAFRAQLDALGLYVFTLNGFPYGAFHGTRVKERVYRPDWRSAARVEYTERLAEVLRDLLPAGVSGSISTVPVGFRPEFAVRAAVEQAVANLLQCAAALWRLHEQSGVEITLALEPEPACYLETTDEALVFFERELLARDALGSLARSERISASQAEAAVRRHLGLCLDTCHAAVEFESAGAAIEAVRASGVRLAKLQATTGLEVAPVDPARLQALRAFADEVYLHQVVARTTRDGKVELQRFVDLDEAFQALEQRTVSDECWRVHFHVPVFERVLEPFTNTQPFLREALAAVSKYELCQQIEVETYTWSVLPERFRTRPLTLMIADELRWVRDELSSGASA